jgi:predicted phage tail protein
MKVVKVYGELKKRLGGQGVFKLDVRTPAEAIRALCANFAGLEQWLSESHKDGVYYRVLLGKETIEEENVEKLLHPWSEQDTFKITPVVTGAGRGFGRFLAGALLVATVGLTGGFGTFASGTGFFGGSGLGFTAGAGLGGSLAAAAGNLGLYMMLSGVAQMISPTPQAPNREANKIKNYSFSGITNTTAQGFPVPIVYGRCFTGSAVISAGLDVV